MVNRCLQYSKQKFKLSKQVYSIVNGGLQQGKYEFIVQ